MTRSVPLSGSDASLATSHPSCRRRPPRSSKYSASMLGAELRPESLGVIPSPESLFHGPVNYQFYGTLVSSLTKSALVVRLWRAGDPHAGPRARPPEQVPVGLRLCRSWPWYYHINDSAMAMK